MKKLFLLCFFLLTLTGCTNKKSDLEILNNVMNSIILPTETDCNLDLPTTFIYEEYTIYATWSSDDTDYLLNDGTIIQADDDTLVSLSVQLTLNEETLYKYFEITIKAINKEAIANEILDLIVLPSEIESNITLSSFVSYNNNNYKVNWSSSNNDVLSNKGIITYQPIDHYVTLTASISYDKVKYTKDFNILVKAFDTKDMTAYLESILIASEISSNIQLPDSFSNNGFNYHISWSSNNTDILSNTGTIGICVVDTPIRLKATISIDNVSFSKEFDTIVKKSSNDQIFEIIENNIKVQKIITGDIFLPTELGYNIICNWVSSDESIISSSGNINTSLVTPTRVTLTANIKIGDETMTKEFNATISPTKHFYLSDKFVGTLENLELTNTGRLVLKEGALTGSFTSEEVPHEGFTEAVASWGALTSKEATCELLVSVKVNDTFSDYISYGEWGLGLQNKCIAQRNNLIKLVEDEIVVLNNKEATGFKYKFILRRKNINISSPEAFLIAISFKINNYSYSVDPSLLKQSVKYDVPKLCQHDVPTIGNIICSATSSTMLLKYKGHDFSKINVLEHEYIAALVKDYGNNIYGNWVYNCVGMSAFNEFAYVKRFADTTEFLYSLQEIGPMAASIRGTVNYTRLSDGVQKSYYTAGHLLVVTGYEIIDNSTYIYINDPNVSTVAIKLTLEDFLSVWRNVSYIIE